MLSVCDPHSPIAVLSVCDPHSPIALCRCQGLSDLFFDNQPSMTLVSNGAECISISKKLFMEHASHAFVTRIREDVS